MAAEGLCVPDARIISNPFFQATALDAERIVPLHTVAPESLRDYIVAQKAAGWVCVALEQAAHSVLLGSAACQLPDRMLLVLGAEREGLPPPILALADIVVEIPQLGVLRSLNVHVSASLVLFEYTKQRFQRAAARAEMGGGDLSSGGRG